MPDFECPGTFRQNFLYNMNSAESNRIGTVKFTLKDSFASHELPDVAREIVT